MLNTGAGSINNNAATDGAGTTPVLTDEDLKGREWYDERIAMCQLFMVLHVLAGAKLE